MCGIIGYIGSKPCVDILYHGLKKLEYRGYDSAGLATVHANSIKVIKAEGKLANLKPYLSNLPPEATVGLGHTRWATHGPPTTTNAHPHAIPELAIVHNGIIENYQDLKAGLTAGGVKIISDTDTEVVLHLLHREFEKYQDMDLAIQHLIPKLRGAYSLGIINPQDNESIYLVKQGSPLVVGLGDGENFFASDAAALAAHTKKTLVLKDGQYAKIGREYVTLRSFDGRELTQEVMELEWNEDAVEKGGFAHYMLKEIHEQPIVLAKLASALVSLENNSFRTDALGLDKLDLDRVQRVDLIGCGTAYLSGVIGKYLIEKYAGIPANAELASEYRYREPYLNENTLFIAISQSGETADTLAALKLAKEKGAQIFSICNVAHSEIPRLSDATLNMQCGPEIGVASTKAFTSMVLSQILFAMALGVERGHIDSKLTQETFDCLRALPHHVQTILDQTNTINELAHHYCESSNFLYIGRGENFAIAYEGALKLKEISYIHAEAYGAGELKHGPIALIDPFMPVMAIAPQDRYYDKTIANIEEVKARKGRVLGIGSRDDKQLENLCDHLIACPQVEDSAMQAILNTIPLQLFSYYVALLRGTDVDQPRNLAKSVTVE